MEFQQLGPYIIGRVLGRGGMGAVYEASHAETGVPAAVKVLLSNMEDDTEGRVRFELEINALKHLHHPNIVCLYGFGEEQEVLYYAMEYVDGPSLQHELKRQRLFTWQEAAKIGIDMSLALRHAHDRGITHRDIKPGNILLTQSGNTKLSDFGIAQNFGVTRITGTHAVVGTLEFMSPEQALANPIGPKSDLFSLGAVLYLLLTGKVPFSAHSLPELIRKHAAEAYDPIKSARFDVPVDVEAIIGDLLRFRPENRPANAYIVAKRFQSILHALSGPPEDIHVLPMTEATPRIPPPIPPPSLLQRSMVPDRDDSIVDLGNIIIDATKPLPSESDIDTAVYIPAKEQKDEGLPQDEGFDDVTAAYTTSNFNAAKAKTTTMTLDSESIRHGEILFMNSTGIRRSKDEPIPAFKSFGTVSEPASVPAEITQSPALAKDAQPESPAESPPVAISPLLTSVLRNSSFVAVTDTANTAIGEAASADKPPISLQVVLISLVLLLTGIIVYYLLQPVPPEKLYDRIRAILNKDDSANGYSLPALRSAQGGIEQFLSDYPHHPLAEQVQSLYDELELAEHERRYNRQHFLSSIQRLSPVEIAYTEAVAASKTDLSLGIVKLKAFIDLFGNQSSGDNGTDGKKNSKRLSSPVEICVQLAQRRLVTIEHEFAIQNDEQVEMLRHRLLYADSLEQTHPDRAKAIRRAVVELYKDRTWAKPIVEEAKNKL